MNALHRFGVEYGQIKDKLSKSWYQLQDRILNSPEFLSSMYKSNVQMNKHTCWVEWQLLQQNLILFDECTKARMRDACYLIAINTRFLAEEAIRNKDFALMRLCTKFFNTYLRTAINAKDVRISCNLIHQYTRFTKFLLGDEVEQQRAEQEMQNLVQSHKRSSQLHTLYNIATRAARFMPTFGSSQVFSRSIPTWKLKSSSENLYLHALRTAWYLRYYSLICLERSLGSVCESIAQSVGQICATAHKTCIGKEVEVHDKMLDIFLTVDDTPSSTGDEHTLQGIRQAQVMNSRLFACVFI